MRWWHWCLIGGSCLFALCFSAYGFYVYAHAHDGNFRESIGIVVEDGSPSVVLAECGAARKIGEIDIREVPPGGDHPQESDRRVFHAMADGAPTAIVEIASEVPGYAVTMFEPVNPDTQYYLYDLRDNHGVNVLAEAPDFRLADLPEDSVVTLVSGDESNMAAQGSSVEDWVAATSC